MMALTRGGLWDRPIDETPIAIIDFETTGLTPGMDRVVELSVLRLDPGRRPRMALDTLVNPRRRMAATEIHGITDRDVADAPEFHEIADAFQAALSGCAVAAYNVYFDIKFLEFELGRLRLPCQPPHFCLMYLRPMLGLGPRCSLDLACRCHGIAYSHAHQAAADVLAAAKLWRLCQQKLRASQVNTFGDLAGLRDYRFVQSFVRNPLPHPKALPDSCKIRLKSRFNP